MATQFKLYNGGVVEEMANNIAAMAEAKGLTLSRWQANKGNHATTITYALHTGERAPQFRLQADGTVVDFEKLSQLEGSTPRCEAYKALVKLANVVESYVPVSV